jgi:hypothetical protein
MIEGERVGFGSWGAGVGAVVLYVRKLGEF